MMNEQNPGGTMAPSVEIVAGPGHRIPMEIPGYRGVHVIAFTLALPQGTPVKYGAKICVIVEKMAQVSQKLF